LHHADCAEVACSLFVTSPQVVCENEAHSGWRETFRGEGFQKCEAVHSGQGKINNDGTWCQARMQGIEG